MSSTDRPAPARSPRRAGLRRVVHATFGLVVVCVATASCGGASRAADAPLGQGGAPEAAPAAVTPGSGPYFEFQVDQPARQLPISQAPVYPAALRSAAIEGEVLAQFAVGTDGRARERGFVILRSSHEQVSQAVREALPGFRFRPARRRGRPVVQLVQQPFTFRVAR